jgi:hypothetical protein
VLVRVGHGGAGGHQVGRADPPVGGRLFQGDPRVAPEEDAAHAGDHAHILDAADALKGCPAELAKAFHDLNLKPAALDAKRFDVPGIEVALIPQDDYCSPDRPSWNGVDVRYPRSDGVTLFSRVAVSADGTLAVVHVSTQVSTTFGYGDVVLLRKEKSGWKVIESRMTWIS